MDPFIAVITDDDYLAIVDQKTGAIAAKVDQYMDDCLLEDSSLDVQPGTNTLALVGNGLVQTVDVKELISKHEKKEAFHVLLKDTDDPLDSIRDLDRLGVRFSPSGRLLVVYTNEHRLKLFYTEGEPKDWVHAASIDLEDITPYESDVTMRMEFDGDDTIIVPVATTYLLVLRIVPQGANKFILEHEGGIETTEPITGISFYPGEDRLLVLTHAEDGICSFWRRHPSGPSRPFERAIRMPYTKVYIVDKIIDGSPSGGMIFNSSGTMAAHATTVYNVQNWTTRCKVTTSGQSMNDLSALGFAYESDDLLLLGKESQDSNTIVRLSSHPYSVSLESKVVSVALSRPAVEATSRPAVEATSRRAVEATPVVGRTIDAAAECIIQELEGVPALTAASFGMAGSSAQERLKCINGVAEERMALMVKANDACCRITATFKARKEQYNRKLAKKLKLLKKKKKGLLRRVSGVVTKINNDLACISKAAEDLRRSVLPHLLRFRSPRYREVTAADLAIVCSVYNIKFDESQFQALDGEPLINILCTSTTELQLHDNLALPCVGDTLRLSKFLRCAQSQNPIPEFPSFESASTTSTTTTTTTTTSTTTTAAPAAPAAAAAASSAAPLPESISDWLEQHGLDDFKSAFAEHRIIPDHLPRLKPLVSFLAPNFPAQRRFALKSALDTLIGSAPNLLGGGLLMPLDDPSPVATGQRTG
jgi:hypothetical protein